MQWIGANPSTAACQQAAQQWKRVIHIRVPKGQKDKLRELVEFGRSKGTEPGRQSIEVIIDEF